LNVAENIFLGQQPTTVGGRIDWRKLYSEADHLLTSLGVHLDLKAKARNLSIAQMQSVEIARAFSLHARILIMDEPTSSLTLSEAAELFGLMRRLRSEGTAIIFISHRLEELFEVADQVTVLRDGTYVDTRLVKDVTRDELIRLMVGRTISNLFPKQDVKPGEIALKVDHLTHTGIFKNISFELRRGEILGMAGLVGAGRTDVARAIFGVVPPSSGTIEVEGRQVEITSPQQAISLGLAYVPEDRQLHGLITAMNITSNISLPILKEYARQSWLKDKVERLAAFNAARQMEVRANSMWQIARTLSGGNQQKVVLAKWLSTKPRILILDEPTRGIDVGTKAAVHALMSKLAAEGLAILMISSELPEVLGMSDRILVMHEGQMTGLFSRAEATQEKVISAATQTIPTGRTM
jgi:rhamnose transport system ATP-binding protein